MLWMHLPLIRPAPDAMTPARARTTDNFNELLRYNDWANERVLETLRSATDAPDRALELLSHLLRAQDMWYGRVDGTDHTNLALWATDDLEACARRSEASTERWLALLDRFGGEGLDESIAYENTSGDSFTTPLRDILSHVINHGTHHRAQIALVLRTADIVPPATDYIFYLRDE